MISFALLPFKKLKFDIAILQMRYLKNIASKALKLMSADKK